MLSVQRQGAPPFRQTFSSIACPAMTDSMAIDRVLTEVEAGRDELLAFTASLIRIPTVNPPGECYRDCAELIGERLSGLGLDVEFVEAQNRPEHTAEHPRVNVIGSREWVHDRVSTSTVTLMSCLQVMDGNLTLSEEKFGMVGSTGGERPT